MTEQRPDSQNQVSVDPDEILDPLEPEDPTGTPDPADQPDRSVDVDGNDDEELDGETTDPVAGRGPTG